MHNINKEWKQQKKKPSQQKQRFCHYIGLSKMTKHNNADPVRLMRLAMLDAANSRRQLTPFRKRVYANPTMSTSVLPPKATPQQPMKCTATTWHTENARIESIATTPPTQFAYRKPPRPPTWWLAQYREKQQNATRYNHTLNVIKL